VICVPVVGGVGQASKVAMVGMHTCRLTDTLPDTALSLSLFSAPSSLMYKPEIKASNGKGGLPASCPGDGLSGPSRFVAGLGSLPFLLACHQTRHLGLQSTRIHCKLITPISFLPPLVLQHCACSSLHRSTQAVLPPFVHITII
jgi:hypothetical protein